MVSLKVLSRAIAVILFSVLLYNLTSFISFEYNINSDTLYVDIEHPILIFQMGLPQIIIIIILWHLQSLLDIFNLID